MPPELSLREHDIGGLLRPAVLEHPSRASAAMQRFVLLIHGYNVTLCKAGCDYGAFADNVRATTWWSVVTRFYWPGDANPPFGRWLAAGLRRTLSGASYMLQIRTAGDAAQRLFQWFCPDSPPTRQPEVSIVAHSLGCRLALELLAQLAGQRPTARPRVTKVILMAAAVPRYMVEERGRLREAVALPQRIIALHSTADRTLNWMFRLGEAQEYLVDAGDALRWTARGAIGRHGLPSLSNGHNVFAWRADHGDYWPSRDIARAVDGSLTAILRPGTPRPDRPPERDVEPRDVVVRRTSGRSPGTRVPGGERGLCQRCGPCR